MTTRGVCGVEWFVSLFKVRDTSQYLSFEGNDLVNRESKDAEESE